MLRRFRSIEYEGQVYLPAMLQLGGRLTWSAIVSVVVSDPGPGPGSGAGHRDRGALPADTEGASELTADC